MRKFLMTVLLLLLPFATQAQQIPAPAQSAIEAMTPSSFDTEKIVPLVVGAALGAVAGAFVLPVTLTTIAAAASAIAQYGYPFLGGVGAVVGGWVGYNM